MINYLLLGMTTFKVSTLILSDLPLITMTTLCCWYSCGFWQRQRQSLELVRPTTSFWDLEKGGLDFKPVQAFLFKKPSESQRSHAQATKNCPAWGALWHQVILAERCLLKGWLAVPGAVCQATSLWNKSSSHVAVSNLCYGLHCSRTKVNSARMNKSWGKTTQTNTVLTKSFSWVARQCILQYP